MGRTILRRVLAACFAACLLPPPAAADGGELLSCLPSSNCDTDTASASWSALTQPPARLSAAPPKTRAHGPLAMAAEVASALAALVLLRWRRR